MTVPGSPQHTSANTFALSLLTHERPLQSLHCIFYVAYSSIMLALVSGQKWWWTVFSRPGGQCWCRAAGNLWFTGSCLFGITHNEGSPVACSNLKYTCCNDRLNWKELLEISLTMVTMFQVEYFIKLLMDLDSRAGFEWRERNPYQRSRQLLRRCLHRMQVNEKFAYKNPEMRTNEKK